MISCNAQKSSSDVIKSLYPQHSTQKEEHLVVPHHLNPCLISQQRKLLPYNFLADHQKLRKKAFKWEMSTTELKIDIANFDDNIHFPSDGGQSGERFNSINLIYRGRWVSSPTDCHTKIWRGIPHIWNRHQHLRFFSKFHYTTCPPQKEKKTSNGPYPTSISSGLLINLSSLFHRLHLPGEKAPTMRGQYQKAALSTSGIQTFFQQYFTRKLDRSKSVELQGLPSAQEASWSSIPTGCPWEEFPGAKPMCCVQAPCSAYSLGWMMLLIYFFSPHFMGTGCSSIKGV